jgi:hypothetical protein
MIGRWCCALAFAMASSASAQDVEISKLREELKELQQRMQVLENRLREAATSKSENAFNPGISVILQGTAARSSRDPNNFQITGFAPTGGEVGPAPRGFGLGESELVLSGNIDPYFRGVVVAALAPDNALEVEEAYFHTLALGNGFTVKGGRFLSAIGYQNEIHQHAWEFQDAPLPYKAFLGGRWNDDGVQLRWVAPTPFFLELGSELGRGRSFPGTSRNKSGASAVSLFGHVGGDLGSSLAWRTGLSHLRTAPQDRAFNDVDSAGNAVVQSFTGASRLWIADFVLKWAPGGNARSTSFKLQGEYFRRTEGGNLTYDDTAQVAPAGPQFGVAFNDRFDTRQSGWYLQGVYQFMPRWRAGYRYDRLNYGTVDNAIIGSGVGPTAADFRLLATAHSPTRNSFMVDWSPTEFSRFRVQLASDKSRFNATDNQLLLQYIHSLGAHGAHRF